MSGKEQTWFSWVVLVWHGKWEARPADKLYKHSLSSWESQLVGPNYQRGTGAVCPLSQCCSEAWRRQDLRLGLLPRGFAAAVGSSDVCFPSFGGRRLSSDLDWTAVTHTHTHTASFWLFGASVLLSNACCFTMKTLFPFASLPALCRAGTQHFPVASDVHLPANSAVNSHFLSSKSSDLAT